MSLLTGGELANVVCGDDLKVRPTEGNSLVLKMIRIQILSDHNDPICVKKTKMKFQISLPQAYGQSVRSRETVYHIVPFSNCMYANDQSSTSHLPSVMLQRTCHEHSNRPYC